MKYFSSRICNFYMQKLSTAAAAAAAKILLKKRRNFVKLTFFTYNIKKQGCGSVFIFYGSGFGSRA
jgi:hypothetical protein